MHKKMVNKRIKIFLAIFVMFLFIYSNVFAIKLNIGVTTDKNKYAKGEKVNVTVNWTPEMQAAGFLLKYDSSKVKFDSASVESSFYNSDTKGEISVNWASFEEKNTKSISFSFTTIEEGDCTFQVSNPNAFATGNLEIPDEYGYISNGIKSITIGSDNEESGTVVNPDNEQPKSNITDEDEEEEEEEKEEEEIKEETNKESNNGSGNGQTNNDADKSANAGSNSNSDSSSSSSSGSSSSNNFPKTGLENGLPAVIGILVVLSIFSYKKYKNLSGI